MHKIKKLQADHIYMIGGASTANSAFFENESDCKQFLELADRFLKPYLSINAFQNNRDGWAMIVTTKSADVIRRAYKERRSKSTKCKKACAFNEIWRILSDQVRIFLSTYVKATNFRTGRTGGKVRSNYERFVFEDGEEALQMKKKLANQQYVQAQKKKRYRPAKKLCKIRRKLFKTSPYLSCALLTTSEKIVKLGLSCLDFGVFVGDVLRKLIQATLNYHFPT